MIYHEAARIPYYSFECLAQHGEIVHAVFTRVGGFSKPPFAGLNVGRLVGDDLDAVGANHHAIYETLGLCAEQVVTARQVHGNEVAVVDADHLGKVLPATDALVTGATGIALMLRFADCLPILLYDQRTRAIGLGHAGWRGTAGGLARRMVSVMVECLGTDPAETIACLGPAIGPCCYEVGPDVAQLVESSLPRCGGALLPTRENRLFLDLWEANRQQLSQAGIREIETSRLCTACHIDRFFSHRAEGGTTGRFAAVIGIREPSG
jgi:YfiH family protein